MSLPNVLMIGTGEYTTGYVGGKSSDSDKKIGVVALTLFDLRRRNKVGKLSMVGTNGIKFPYIRRHFDKNISKVYNDIDVSFDSYPPDDVERDIQAYKEAINNLSKGDAITIFTPDTTHYEIALYAIEKGIHVLITKPAVKTIKHHQDLIKKAKENNVFIYIEHHKRFDPAYSDARHKAKTQLGDFNYFYSYMSQPKFQLKTFSSWAGKESDISYYLNSHHIDVNVSMVPGWRPIKVTGSSSKGVANNLGCVAETEDTITLMTEWMKRDEPLKRATSLYTSSWVAPESAGVHSNQYFHYMASKGEIRINQGKRGYDLSQDQGSITWYNPFYMKYSPDENGDFDGKTGYGYISFEKFIDSITLLNQKKITISELDLKDLPTLKNTLLTTVILEAGRRSIDEKKSIEILENENENGQWLLG